ncbi:hypothetical protein [Helicobacter pylori]|uniref:hypothetical protein n=1 Tax=Helicobacter pylori TaxID=210 RepID=UPI00165AD6F1|nr:hypothetical protein [Helicobacter pylori]
MTGFIFSLFINFENKQASCGDKPSIDEEMPIEFFDDAYKIEYTIREIIDSRCHFFSLESIGVLEKTWGEFEKYLREKEENFLIFEKLMVFFFRQGRFLRFKK